MKENGIGLVTLVLTIVVLLMIAAVAVSMLVGDETNESSNQQITVENRYTNEEVNNTYQ